MRTEPSISPIEELDMIASYFAMIIYQIVHFDEARPTEVNIEVKAGFKQIYLINQLEDDYKNTVFKIIDSSLPKIN